MVGWGRKCLPHSRGLETFIAPLCMGLPMAEELRGTNYHVSTATDLDGTKLLENTADRDLFVRKVGFAGFASGNAASSNGYFIQMGKNNAYTETDNDSGVRFNCIVFPGSQTNTASRGITKDWWLAKGQFVLEPGETLYYNQHEVGDCDEFESTIDIWYHY